MVQVRLAGPVDFDGWRQAVRRLAQAGVAPEAIAWRCEDDPHDLFGGANDSALPLPEASEPFRVPRRFLDLAELVICHRDAARFDLLYRLLTRQREDAHVLERTTDDDVFAADRMAKAVRRERHKMTAFVRFRAVAGTDDHFLAWFEPDHHVVALTAPFFVRRFAAMRWSILTPLASAHWDGTALTIGEGAQRTDAPSEDALDEFWRTYYAHIFNPARLKVAAMTREMPKRYWKNLPEARLIQPLTRSASTREDTMVRTGPSVPAPRADAILRRQAAARVSTSDISVDERPRTLDAARLAAAACRRCPLYGPATQTVFGEGAPDADMVFVGEQPGDREDLMGRPFVGPAGRLFDRALVDAGIVRERIYVTNAVKHFKFTPRGKARLHKSPNAMEIDACRDWLVQEAALIRPKLVVALGASALRSLTGDDTPLQTLRGRVVESDFAGRVFVTVHPAFLLRSGSSESGDAGYRHFVADLAAAAQLAG